MLIAQNLHLGNLTFCFDLLVTISWLILIKLTKILRFQSDAKERIVYISARAFQRIPIPTNPYFKEYSVARIGFDTAENESCKVCPFKLSKSTTNFDSLAAFCTLILSSVLTFQ